MEAAQREEYSQIAYQQQIQFVEFSRAWDDYMQNYENAAVQSVSKLKQRHVQDLIEVRDNVVNNLNIKYTLSKDLMNIRAQERLAFQVKDFDKAEILREKGDQLERVEKQRIEGVALAQKLEKEEVKLKQLQQA